ncbi:NAD(P)-dependent oxidoreductase [Caballeronia sordidicola]|nr:NAD(P)-dependent oxidoreductase [Caballeronia sordidicola]
MANAMERAETLAFLGTGLMGERQARVLLRAGYRLTAWNRTRDKAERLSADGARVADSPAQAVRSADIVITMLANGETVHDVLFEQGVCEALSGSAVVIDMSSIRPDEAIAHARLLAQRGIDHIDAPVSGGTSGAEKAALAIMCGGEAEAFERVSAVLRCMGRPVLMGAHGTGQLAKLANQMIVGTTIGVVAEALSLVAKGGANPAMLIEALAGGYADSTILRIHGRRMVDKNFEVSGRSSTQLKDLHNALRAAQEAGAAMPYTELSAQRFTSLLQQHGDIDHSGVVLTF